MDRAILADAGIDYEKGLARCLNDAEFYKVILTMFLEDDSFQRALQAYETGTTRELFQCAHELKGVSGNADLTLLYNAVCPLVELLRQGDGTQAQRDELFAQVQQAYNTTRSGVEKALNP